MEKVAVKRRRREREALLELPSAQCRVDPAVRAVDGVTTVETAGAQIETPKDQIEEDHDHDQKEVDDNTAAMEAARDHAPEAEEEGREVETTHGIREKDESTAKKENRDAAGLRIVVT